MTAANLASGPVRDDGAPRIRNPQTETPPPGYWRRWSGTEAPATAGLAAMPSQPAGTIAAGDGDATGTGPTAAPAPADDSPYRVLIVEDDRSQALFAQSVLHGAGMQAMVLTRADGVLPAIAAYRPDLVLMDLHLPETDGMRLTAMIRQNRQWQRLPIVFLTGDRDPERQYEVLDSGADDFLVKPIRPRHLIAAVANRIRRSRQQDQPPPGPGALPRAPEPPGLASRGHLDRQLDAALAAGAAGGLFFIEIAGALGLRERYGYAAFERLMLQAGLRLSEAAGDDLLARLGDNSFLLLSRGAEADLAARARELARRLSAQPCLARDDEPVHLRSTIGHAPLDAGFGDAGSALEAVERAALQARLQRDGVHGFSAAEAEADTLAMVEGQLEPAYQPIVAVAGSDCAQYQVLLRLRRADGTLLSAGQVVPAAEAAGRIADLDQQVLEHALELLDRYRHATPPLRLFVSQSPRTLARQPFADWLLANLERRRLAGAALVIDLRLDDALIHTLAVQRFCEQLAPAGVQFCLSRFEPGPEAEALPGLLPLRYLRVAGRFAASHGDEALREELRALIDGAHRAGLQVIGQQIEDAQAAAAMWGGGVDFIQGNLVQSVSRDLDFDFKNAIV
ncbi:EAL domain-containing protein [Stenotrophomonas sp. MMGLT7]|uniref:EAL domain-containing protein n=1 Tax=Stenotrophomonas sp. MMGLT7 TaxID=2901227 RepID=UPI001E426B96|nr:EAL domain-containing protein [Stenotrophomonas sp. MMGLT7]MCD7097928.1 EAL domain-containing protein [Stenotrophomonas sp. MMGLT7]